MCFCVLDVAKYLPYGVLGLFLRAFFYFHISTDRENAEFAGRAKAELLMRTLEHYVQTSCSRPPVSSKAHHGYIHKSLNGYHTNDWLGWSRFEHSWLNIRCAPFSGLEGGQRIKGGEGNLAWCRQGWRTWLHCPANVDLRWSRCRPKIGDSTRNSPKAFCGMFQLMLARLKTRRVLKTSQETGR